MALNPSERRVIGRVLRCHLARCCSKAGVAIKTHRAVWRDELGVLDKAVRPLAHWHEMRTLDRPRILGRVLLGVFG
jgi:hypothetical protein